MFNTMPSSYVHKRIRCPAAVLLGGILACPTAVHGGGIDTPPPLSCSSQESVPANVSIVNTFLQRLVSDMALRSPAFRQRLQTIGQTPSLRVRIRFVLRTATYKAIAQTVFSRTKTGWLFADVQLAAHLVFARQDVVMIAHEIEHVVEQVEGLDLKGLARTPQSGVYRLDGVRDRIYETDRATAFGQLVEDDFHRHKRGNWCTAD